MNQWKQKIKNTNFSKKIKWSLFKFFILAILTETICHLLLFAIIFLINYLNTKEIPNSFLDFFQKSYKYLTINILNGQWLWLFIVIEIIIIGLVLIYVVRDLYKKIKKVDKDTIETKEDDKWLINEYKNINTLKKNKSQVFFDDVYANNLKNPGWCVRASLNNKKKPKQIKFNMINNISGLILGTIGSGKTQKIIIPTLIGNSCLSQDKMASLIITDPKGELFNTTSKILFNQGYQIKVLNFRDGKKSSKWNPLHLIWVNYQFCLNAEKNIKLLEKQKNTLWDQAQNLLEINKIKSSKINVPNLLEANDFNLLIKDENYLLEPKSLIKLKNLIETIKTINLKINAYQQKTSLHLQKYQKEILLVAENIVPVNDKSTDRFWDDSARKILTAGIYAMLVDSNFNLENFNLFNLAVNLNNEDNFKNYINQLDINHPAKIAMGNWADQTKDNKTLDSIFSTLKSKINIFLNDVNLNHITKLNSFSLADLDEKPTALFLIIPDDNTIYSQLIQIFLNQQYQSLVYKAENLPDQKLKRKVLFVLEEFGNIGKIENFDKWIAVSRSRGMHWLICVQDILQVTNLYGDKAGETIINQCSLWIFLNSKSDATKQQVLKLIGNKKEGEIANQSLNPTGLEQNLSESFQEKPLLNYEDLSRMPADGALLLLDNHKPSFIKCGMAYQLFQNEPDYQKSVVFARNEIIKNINPFYLSGNKFNYGAIEDGWKNMRTKIINHFFPNEFDDEAKIRLDLIKYLFIEFNKFFQSITSKKEIEIINQQKKLIWDDLTKWSQLTLKVIWKKQKENFDQDIYQIGCDTISDFSLNNIVNLDLEKFETWINNKGNLSKPPHIKLDSYILPMNSQNNSNQVEMFAFEYQEEKIAIFEFLKIQNIVINQIYHNWTQCELLDWTEKDLTLLTELNLELNKLELKDF
ncbi:Type IV secretory system conjugative DNA transfer family protein [[Mycoplasma] cavipharyngis]|uniref:type IV secretory system conjugative DNA transfer family protein n=1 Tax=[Mycoplasma] cavipharyngis TaxID=92757 RepID=UPI003703D5C4